jgi:methylmalonyl-CoA/ethylmalonyl-CoA epimerase
MSERVSSKQHFTSELSAAESSAQNWQPLGTFHHVGFVVPSIHAVVQSFAESLQAVWDGNIIHDLNQDVRVTFLRSRVEGDPLFELVEPASEKSPVNSFLKRGGGLNHVCYVVDSLEKHLELCRSQGALVVRNPLPAAAFGGRRIAWVYTKHKLLIEYLERR